MSSRQLRQFARFAVVGGAGFLVDAGVLFGLVWLGFGPLPARAMSFALAVTVTWQLNRAWVFAGGPGTTQHGARYWRYLMVQCVGAAVNMLCYSLTLPFFGSTPSGAVLALGVGSAVGLVVNFFGASRLVFRQGQTHHRR